MKTTYKFSKSNLIPGLHKKHIKFLLDKVEKEGAERVRIVKEKRSTRSEKPYTGVEMLYFPKSNTVYVQWRKNGLIHKLDGPAEEGYFINNEEIRLVNQVYCYNSEYCFVYLNTDRVIKEAESLGRLVLDHEKLSDNIYLFKLLAADKLEERYCWIIDGV
jgi:hypothetical protein